MTVNLRDRVFNDTGGVVSGATVQAITVTGGGTDVGTSSVVTATTTTDVNGMWKFTALADPGAGNWYDVKITNGSQVRWRYGNIQAAIQQILLAASISVTGLTVASGTVDFTGATVIANLPRVSNLLPADVTLTAQNTYYNGPTVALTAAATYLLIGKVTFLDPTAAALFNIRLQNAATLIEATQSATPAAYTPNTVTIMGIVTGQTSVQIAVANSSRAGGSILANASGQPSATDSSLYAIRIA
jgi:hypothetical protein